MAAPQFGQLPVEQLALAKVPAPLIAFLRSMLACDRADRPQSARELLIQLQRCRQLIEGGRRHDWRTELFVVPPARPATNLVNRADRGREEHRRLTIRKSQQR